MSGADSADARRFFERRPEVALAGVTLLWGSTFVVTHHIVADAPPLAYLTARYGIGALVLFALFPRSLRPSRRLLSDGAILGALQAFGLLLQVLGQVYTTSSKSAFVTSLSTALTPILALALHGDRPTRPQATGVLLASLGLYLLTYPTNGAAWNRGDVLTIGSALVYTVLIVEVPRRARHHGAGELAAHQTGFGAILFLVALGAVHALAGVHGRIIDPLLAVERRPLALDGLLVAEVLYMALVCTVVTFLAQMWAMARMSATHCAVIFALEPVWATLLAVAVDGTSEWPGARGGVGAGLVVAGVLASELRWGALARGREGVRRDD